MVCHGVNHGAGGIPTRGTNQHAGKPRDGRIKVWLAFGLLFFSGIEVIKILNYNNMCEINDYR